MFMSFNLFVSYHYMKQLGEYHKNCQCAKDTGDTNFNYSIVQ